MSTSDDRRRGLLGLVEGEGVSRVSPPLLLDAGPYFDLAGEEFGRRMFLTASSEGAEFALRPDFTLPIASAYLREGLLGSPVAFSYLGPVFRQRPDEPAEFEQAGIELLGQPDADPALDRVFAFAGEALRVFSVQSANIRLGSISLFEAMLAGAELPDVWRARIRSRFGHPDALMRLLNRLSSPHANTSGGLPWNRPALIGAVGEKMEMAGLSSAGGRTAIEIADRYLDKQKLAASPVPAETLALLKTYLSLSGDFAEGLDKVNTLAHDRGIDVLQPLQRLLRHAEGLAAGTPEAILTFDAGFSPNLDYYTGVVFEVTGEGGRVLASGGEYDRLLERLGAGGPVAASGCAVWVDRLEREAAR